MKNTNTLIDRYYEWLIDRYYKWLKEKTICKNINQWTEITTPYLDRNNDYIQIYLKKNSTGYLLTDDGWTIEGLKQEGCVLDSPKRQQLLQLTLRGHGVKEDKGQLQVTADSENDFPLCKHSLVQAMLAVNDMFYTASSHVSSLFFEEVRNWLEKSHIRYSERISFKGLSPYSRHFDFLIPKSSKQPERLIKTINHFTKSQVDSIVMSWLDTKETRPEKSRLYAFINNNTAGVTDSNNMINGALDSKSAVGSECHTLKQYGICPVLWNERDSVQQELES